MQKILARSFYRSAWVRSGGCGKVEAGKRPFQLIWEAMDRQDIEITNHIPQGPFLFEASGQRCNIVSKHDTFDFGDAPDE